MNKAPAGRGEGSSLHQTGKPFSNSASTSQRRRPTAGLFRGRHPELGEMFAAWDDGARFVQAAVMPSRFEARLHPFRWPDAARDALTAAGAAIEVGDGG